jgi:hypothetical protein
MIRMMFILLLALEHGEHTGLHEAEEARLVLQEAAQEADPLGEARGDAHLLVPLRRREDAPAEGSGARHRLLSVRGVRHRIFVGRRGVLGWRVMTP